MRTNELPLLLVVAGPPGSGKTTLSRTVAGAAYRPDISREELRSRQARARLKLLRCHAPDDVWFERFRARAPRPGHADDQFIARTLASGGPDAGAYRLDLPGVPTLDADTTAGYRPALDEIVAFVTAPW